MVNSTKKLTAAQADDCGKAAVGPSGAPRVGGLWVSSLVAKCVGNYTVFTLPPIIMEVENDPDLNINETHLGGIHCSLP